MPRKHQVSVANSQTFHLPCSFVDALLPNNSLGAVMRECKARGPMSAGHPLAPVGSELIRAVAGRITAHLRDARLATLTAYFAAGDEIHDLRSSHAYARGAILALANELGMDQSALQKWGRLSEAIRGEERLTICALVDKSGLPLQPSLLVELERVRDRTTRLQLVQAALREPLSVKELRQCVSTLKGRPSPKSTTRVERHCNTPRDGRRSPRM